jgi:VWFA-related protein
MAAMNRISGLWLLTVLFVASAVSQAQFTIKVDVELTDVNFSVTDRRGRTVPGLAAGDFIVEEDGRQQEIVRFSRENELPLTMAILLDVSPSVRPVFAEELRTTSAFVEAVMRPKDIVMLITFDERVTLVQDFTDSPSVLRDAIMGLRLTGPGTSLYDAIYLATSEKLAREVGRKTVLIISDGKDESSEVDLSKAIIAAHQSHATIYSISNAGGTSGTLRRLSEETGGNNYTIRREGDFARVFEEIAAELRTQYSLSYHSSNTTRDGRFRRIRIIPQQSGLNVRSRRGYFAPGPGPTGPR